VGVFAIITPLIIVLAALLLEGRSTADGELSRQIQAFPSGSEKFTDVGSSLASCCFAYAGTWVPDSPCHTLCSAVSGASVFVACANPTEIDMRACVRARACVLVHRAGDLRGGA
jgi:hypothetical protein